MLMRVILNGLVEASECVVDHRALSETRDDAIIAQMNTIVDSEASILRMLIFIIHVVSILGALKTFFLTVLMDSPKDVNTVIDSLLVAISAEKGWRKCKESHVLHLQFEHC
jgi:hypothetical protein